MSFLLVSGRVVHSSHRSALYYLTLLPQCPREIVDFQTVALALVEFTVGAFRIMSFRHQGRYQTPLTLCSCQGAWRLSQHHVIQAVVYDLIGKETVHIATKKCQSCGTIFGPTFRKKDGKMLNNVEVSQMASADVLFLTTKVGFTIRYLKYRSLLFFRCATTARGLEWAYEKAFFNQSIGQPAMGWTGHFRELHYDVLFYYLVSIEMEKIGKHTSIVIGRELTKETLHLYDHCHRHILPPPSPQKVTALVGDGHHKVMIKCTSAQASPKRRAGRPRKGSDGQRRHGHGWFMLVDPKTSRILSVVSQDNPEGNEVTSQALLKVLHLYPKVDLFVLDRACAFMPSAKTTTGLEQLKFYAVDKFHAHGHRSACPCHPTKPRLKKRLGSLNTSVAEQTFSWFRTYAVVLNEMRELRHRFAVLWFCQMHNSLIQDGNTAHLNKYKAEKAANRKSKPYACRKDHNKSISKPKKKLLSMKSPKSMKSMKRMK